MLWRVPAVTKSGACEQRLLEKGLGTLPDIRLAEFSHLIACRDDVYAAVCHCLTHLVFYGGPLGGELL